MHKGWASTAHQNPTRMVSFFASPTSRAACAVSHSPGMAATATLLDLLDSGSHVVAMDDLYGGSFRLFERVRRRSANLDFSFVNLSDPKAAAGAIRPNTRMIWIETPTNPLLRLVDIAAIAEIARARKILLVVDNTFTTP